MIYLYKNPESGEIIEVVQSMNDVHEYEENGVAFERVWTVPQAVIGMKVDPYSKRQFLEKTDKPGNVGDLWDRSEELSHMRAEKNGGVDPVKKAEDEKWSKERGGKKLPKKMKDLEVALKL